MSDIKAKGSGTFMLQRGFIRKNNQFFYILQKNSETTGFQFFSYEHLLMYQKGTSLAHDFYIVVGKQCRTENAYAGHQHNIFI